MNIVLIQPPIEDFYATPVRLQPIGIAYLKAVIKKYFPGVRVILKDFQQGYGRQTIPRPAELKFLKEYYRLAEQSPFSTFYQYYRFGASTEQAVTEIAELNPDLVGISLLFTAYAPQALELAKAIKNRLDVPVLLGGSHVSAQPEKLLALPFVDFVVIGEGERPVVRFVEQWLTTKNFNKVPNLGFKNTKTGYIFTETKDNFDINRLPFPDFSDLPANRYRIGKKRLSFLISSRGCPYKCAFCSVHQTFGHAFRLRSVENILAEISLRLARGVQIIDFEDDNLNLDLQRFETLCRALSSEFSDYKVQFMAMNGLSYFRLNERMIELMHRAGFKDLNLSLVSINEALLKQYKRPFDVTKFETVVNRAHALGMNIISYLILGLPGESLESMLQTLIYLARLPVRIGVSPFYLTPGMPVYNQADLPKHPDWVYGRLTSLGATNDDSKRRTIFTLFVMARMINFLKELKFDAPKVSLKDLLENRSGFSGRLSIGFEILHRLLVQERYFIFDGRDFHVQPAFQVSIFKKFLTETQFVKRLDGGDIVCH